MSAPELNESGSPERSSPSEHNHTKKTHPISDFTKRLINIRSKSRIENTPKAEKSHRNRHGHPDRNSVASESSMASSNRHDEDASSIPPQVNESESEEEEEDSDEDDRVLQFEANRDNQIFKLEEANEKLENLEKKHDLGLCDDKKYNKKKMKYDQHIASAEAKIEEINRNLESYKSQKRAKIGMPPVTTGTLMQGFLNKMTKRDKSDRSHGSVRDDSVSSDHGEEGIRQPSPKPSRGGFYTPRQEPSHRSEATNSSFKHRNAVLGQPPLMNTPQKNQHQPLIKAESAPFATPSEVSQEISLSKDSSKSDYNVAPHISSSLSNVESAESRASSEADNRKVAFVQRLKDAMRSEVSTPVPDANSGQIAPLSSKKDKKRHWSHKSRSSRLTPVSVVQVEKSATHPDNAAFLEEIQEKLAKLMADTFELAEQTRENAVAQEKDMEEIRQIQIELEERDSKLVDAQKCIDEYDAHIDKKVKQRSAAVNSRLDSFNETLKFERSNVEVECEKCVSLESKILEGDEEMQRLVQSVQRLSADYQKRPSTIDSIYRWYSTNCISASHKATFFLFLITFGGLAFKLLWAACIRIAAAPADYDELNAECESRIALELSKLQQP